MYPLILSFDGVTFVPHKSLNLFLLKPLTQVKAQV